MRSLDYLKIFLGIRSSKDSVNKLKREIGKIYNKKNVYILENGRTCIYTFLKSLGLPEGSKVAVQAFVCNAVVNPVLWADLEPLYIDIDPENFSMSYEDLLKKIDEKTKVLILQHTFGIEGDRRIVEYCKKKGVILLEDCAHTLGNGKLGIQGDATMLSFGFEKVLPTRVGGALIINNEKYVGNYEEQIKGIKKIGAIDTFLWFLNPFLWRFLRILPRKIRKGTSLWLSKVKILDTGFSEREDRGAKPTPYPRTLSNKLAEVVLECLRGVEDNLSHRREISDVYAQILDQKYSGALVRYPYLLKEAKNVSEVIERLNSLGYPSSERWYFPVIYPSSTELEKMKYVKGSCHVAEDLSSRIINLPTSGAVDLKRAEQIANIVMQYN